MWQFFYSIRFRLTLWYVTILAIVLVAFSALLYLSLLLNLNAAVDTSLRNRAQQLSRSINNEGGRINLRELLPADRLGGQLSARPFFYRVWNAAGSVVEVSNLTQEIAVDPRVIREAARGHETFATIPSPDGDLRLLTVPLAERGQAYGVLEVGESLSDVQATMGQLLLVLVIAVPFTLLLASAGGFFLASRALLPIDRITREARRITAEDLSRRLGLPKSQDEVGRLSQTFDAMIERLDNAFQRQRQFTADASHELRTPLAVLKSEAEVALERPRSMEEYQKALRAIQGEVEHMSRVISDLLLLARADAGEQPLQKEKLALHELLEGVAEHTQRLAAAKGLQFSVEGIEPVEVQADETRLVQLFLNLLDNAVKYTPAGGSIALSSRSQGDWVKVSISDTGVGISPEDQPRIFERFYRVDKARSRELGGTGLGLSIADWIVKAHGGRIEVASTPGVGSSFTVWLPIL